jgi:hypothetical protein
LEKTKLNRDEFWNTVDPDKLNLTKSDILNFCQSCIDEWKENKIANFRYILAISIMQAQIKITPEIVLKKIWKKIILWFYDLTFQNALHNDDPMMKELKRLHEGKKDN